VQVRGWDDFHGELRRRFPLRYRWFGDLPRGIVPIRDKKFESQSFRRFLFGESLPFFSREKYLAESSGQQVTREEHLVSNLAADRSDEALILAGVGGVGKTRLGLELCDRLSKLGWLTLRLTDNATSASVTELIQTYAEPAQIVLLCDYAERADDLSAIAEEISLINESNVHRVRLISTCRMSALSGVQDALVPLTPRDVILATPRVSAPSEIAFTEWVVQQILAFGHIPELEQVARVCRGLPILAAFALFLYRRDPKQFNVQFGDLKEVQDFREWMKRRLKIVLQEQHGSQENEAARHLAMLSLRLPMAKSEADDLADRSPVDRSLLEMMRTDRWIEDSGDNIVAVHDVFADAMVGHYVFETRAVAHGRIAELLRAAIEQDFLTRALLAIDRLIGYPAFDAVDGTAIVRALIVRAPAEAIAAHERLLRGRLVSDRGKVVLLAEYPELYSAVLANRDCDVAVSHIADTLARMRRSDPVANASFVRSAEGIIAPLLAPGLANPHPSNMLLRRAFALMPGTYRGAVLDRITNEPIAIQTHYLLVAWLYAGCPTDEIVSQIGTWLSANAARSPKTSFAVRAWLDADGQRDLIDRHVLAWIEAFGATEAARFVYGAWLDAGGQRDRIDRHVVAWIEAFGATEAARFVYRAWLDAGGQRDRIDRHVLAWIEAFGASEVARFVYQPWLDAGGQRELIDRHILAWIEVFGATEVAEFVYPPWLSAGGQRGLIDRHVLAWIEKFGETERATYVYRAWLEAGGQRDLIDRHVLAWIEAFGATQHAQFVYRAWLVAGGQRDLIDGKVLVWIEVFGETEDAQFVYRAWLDSGGPLGLIERQALAWIGKFGTTEVAQFVFRGWLAAKGDFEAISESCLAWFNGHAADYECSFLLKYITRRKGLPASSLHAAIKWCALFSKHDDAVWRATSLLVGYAHTAEAVAIVRTFLTCIQFLDVHRLSMDSAAVGGEEDASKLAHNVLSALGTSLGVLGLDEVDRHDLRIAHTRLLTNSAIYEAAHAVREPYIYPALVHHVSELIERGLIDLDRDHVGLTRFVDWMRAWPEDGSEDLELAISRLRRSAPSDLWNGIPAAIK
jgi:hypothetical protein